MGAEGSGASDGARCDEHDAVAAELRSWFTTSAPELEIHVAPHWFGHLSGPDGPMAPRLLLTVEHPGSVRDALRDARAMSADRPITVWVDDRARDARLGDALIEAGCARRKATTHLALVGDVRADRAIPGLELEAVGAERLEAWASVKLRCFGDAESEPAPEKLAAELAIRAPELALADLGLVTLHAEPVGVLGYYRGGDQLAFNLGTRLPFRHRGIASEVLRRWTGAARTSGARSVVINADDPGRPQALYRRLGFVDEVFWYQSYELAAGA